MFSKLIAITIATVGATAAQAMPCDTGYSCTSKSGKYEIELQRCRYTNDLRLASLTVDHKSVTDATLGPAWDGKSVGDSLLAFEIDLKAGDGESHVLSVEIPAKKMIGKIKEKFAEAMPEPSKTLHAEAITCQISE